MQFYESVEFLSEVVSDYVSAGLECGEAAVVIATRSHRVGIERQLRARGSNVDLQQREGQLVFLDARETLNSFMVDGKPDPVLFEQVIGQLVAKASAGRPGVRAFGEMVALLWAEGNAPAHIELEELWNELARSHSFTLFCAYPLADFAGSSSSADMTAVCGCHSRVRPSESYYLLQDENERMREVLRLQQRAAALEHEAEERKKAQKVCSCRRSFQEHTNIPD